jgi:hypothetical protein
VKRLVKEPLLQFLVLGAALFGIHAFLSTGEQKAPAKIVVSAAQIANLGQTFARTWQRHPTPEELKGLIEDYVRDEVYYREGKALEIDRDDIVIRRRIRQKMEFFAEDMAASAPTDSELSSYLAAHPERFRTEPTVSFRHIFLNPARRQGLDGDAAKIAQELARPGTDVGTLGDGFLLGSEFDARQRRDVISDFGERFADKLFSAGTGSWQGPFASPFGLHFVLVSKRSEGGLPPLAEVREAVAREWANDRRVAKLEEFYRALRQRYDIVVETTPAMEHKAQVETAGAAQ